MTQQWLRECRLTVSGSSTLTIPGGGPKDLRIEASIGATTLQTPDPGKFRITNPNPQTVAAFKNQEFQTLTFEAGYRGNVGLIHSAEIKQSLYARSENLVDSYIDIFTAVHANAYQQARVGKTLAAGWTPRDKVQIALDAMKPFGITGLGFVNIDLDTLHYPRGRPFIGMARDLIRQVSLSAGGVWSMNNGKVHIVDHAKTLESDGPVILNSKTGLVGFPHATEGGIVARCLLNPAIKILTQVKINEADIIGAERDITHDAGYGIVGSRNLNLDNTGRIADDGLYRVLYLEVECDTRGQAWYQTLTCLATGATPNRGQIESGIVMSQF